VFRVPTDEGQALYGSKYYGAGYFADLHNLYSGNANCDHMHDGIGFVPSHLALTVIIEQKIIRFMHALREKEREIPHLTKFFFFFFYFKYTVGWGFIVLKM
jgi:hypothetical protein